MAPERSSMRLGPDGGTDRGAVMVHVTVALIGLMAFSTFVVDYGVLWVARRQAQNAADAAALAGAMAHAYDDPYGRGSSQVATDAAFAVTQRHPVWGAVPSVVPATDITFPPSPPSCRVRGLEWEGQQCLRVDVYRDRSRGNALPVFFGQLIGLVDQGVRATASARLFRANSVRCMRPWAIPDQLGIPPMISAYLPPTDTDPAGTRTLESSLGRPFVLDGAFPVTAATMVSDFGIASLFPLDLAGDGGASYQANIASCRPAVHGIGDGVTPDLDDLRADAASGVAGLLASDPGATWNSTTYRIDNSCAQLGTCPYTISPRLVPIAVFNPKIYAEDGVMSIVNILGFFVIRMNGDQIEGAFTILPGTIDAGRPHIVEIAAFMKVVSLFR